MDPAPGASPFPTLFSPVTVGGTRIRNRIVSSGHDTVMAADGRVSDRLVAYQEARAWGGAGLIVIQVAGVHPTARYTSSELTADDDGAIPGFARLAEAIHRHGATAFGQLFHGGREIMDTEDGTLAVAWAPSAVPTERFQVMPRAMPEALIGEILAGFGSSAARLEAAGLDGVEVVASHGYLPSQFLNPRTNLRDDGWGGDAARRLRFLREALAACRAATRPGFTVGVRISIGEITPEGHARHPPAAASRDVLVIGGGPAGLKAAAVAAERGHRVTLWEAERWVGGQVRLAQRLPGRAEIGGAITNLEGEARRAGVRIETGLRADVEAVARSGAQVVVVATGSVPYRPPLELVGDPTVLDAWDVIRGNASVPDGHVVVADWRCDWVGLGVATMLAGAGRRVTLASSGYHAGQRLQQYVRDTMIAEARRAHVDLRPTLRPYGADASAVFLQDVLTSEAVVVEPASALVLAQGTVPLDGLLDGLAAAAPDGEFEVHGVGDVLTPRTIEEAVLEGLRVGVAI